MAKSKTKRYGVFNVVAQPHPSDIYRKIFEAAEGVGVKYWGDYYAAITPISATRGNVFTGRLVIWMAVDPDSNVVSLTDFVEVPLSSSNDVTIPTDKGLNSRTFQFAFNVGNHRLFLELNNDEGKNVSPRRAEVAFQKALSEAAIDLVDELRVQIVPASDSVEKILEIENLSMVEIKIFRPNPDTISPEAKAILDEELEDQHAKEVVKTLKRAPSFRSLVLNARSKLMAQAAALDGLVRGKGKDADGKSVEASTSDYPTVIVRVEDVDGTDSAGVRSVAGE
ncbi:protein of unknown function [Octadecabacter temperatus]|uniref:Uncharacterized protein n=1 Tax=Octadecabacter temperatus TaxID=1458307 RepID=A0A0K0Y7A1_9RHOB|nr:DUF4747 family protein [Octadecabacter temperatus]AKS46849.1 hypothetical protein OSB_23130 [Octadecabacter temperatus]SIO22446.1 protein of unknown function [Octadecabacter temperatus]